MAPSPLTRARREVEAAHPDNGWPLLILPVQQDREGGGAETLAHLEWKCARMAPCPPTRQRQINAVVQPRSPWHNVHPPDGARLVCAHGTMSGLGAAQEPTVPLLLQAARGRRVGPRLGAATVATPHPRRSRQPRSTGVGQLNYSPPCCSPCVAGAAVGGGVIDTCNHTAARAT